MKLNTPTSFLEIIPKSIPENIEFRKKLAKLLLDDKYREIFLQMCFAKPQIAFKSVFWTFNPRMRPGFRNIPFITRPAQDEAIDAIKQGIDDGSDVLVDKSRDEGATEIIVKMFALYWLIQPQAMFLMGSRKEEFVDKAGDHKALFYKLRYTINHLPMSLRPPVEDNSMHYANLVNGSVVDGESTNESFGAGDRRLAVLVDEHGRIKHNLAGSIIENLSDTTDCTIINSTHFYGAGHPYNKQLQKGLMSGHPKVIVLPWHRNPVKNQGLYRSPDLNVIEISDIDYYRENYPGCFDNIKKDTPFKLSEFEVNLLSKGLSPEISFVADGGESNDGGWRSLWYDKESQERGPRDIAQNIDRNPIGAGDNFFDPGILRRIRDETVRPPDYEGEIEFDCDKYGKVRNCRFRKDAGRKRFRWWGTLANERPNQSHNFIAAWDISLGTGASNAVGGIYDVNTREKVGMFVCPNTPPESAADMAVAICRWVGGVNDVYLIWESNGPGGSFEKRVAFQGYGFVHYDKNERIPYRKQGKKRGWNSTRTSKYDLLLELRVALSEGLKRNPKHKSLIIHDEASIGECEDYIFYESGEIGLGSCIDEDSGARAAHGDRVIPDGLAVLAFSDQPKAALKEQAKMTYGSFAWRQQMNRRKKRKDIWHE